MQEIKLHNAEKQKRWSWEYLQARLFKISMEGLALEQYQNVGSGFINEFKRTHGIPLDPIYTGKMMFGIFDLIDKGFFKKGSKILAIHTGGLQAISGMNQLLHKKGMPLINL